MTAPIQPTAPTTEATQAIVEQPIPADRVVPDYGLSWSLYIVAACIFLIVLYRLMRKWPKWLLVPVWSACAAGALTTANSTPDGPWLAPAVMVGIFGFDQDGVTGLMRGVVPILFSFVAISVVLGLLFFVLSRWPKPAAGSKASELTDQAVDADLDAERQEAKL